MPTKTERIIANLPGTFKALPRPSTLYSVIEAFGGELLKGENSLAATMLAHWVDHADRGAELIDDLARIGALYGLAPRPDESVEEFRAHLKRYIRTFIEGTVTVQGALRVTAETLALRIADQYEEMDSWWNRSGENLTTVQIRGDDAAQKVLGVVETNVQGDDVQAARLSGTVDLSAGVDLRTAGRLHLQIDGAAPVAIDLAGAASDSAGVTPDEIVSTINSELGDNIAGHEGGRLQLVSPTSGPGNRIDILDGPEDAAPSILGLPARLLTGRDAAPAHVTGTQDLSGDIDLSDRRYLRLFIDGAHLAEIDCAGATPESSSLDEVRDAINAAFGFPLAEHDGQFLTLTSPTTGLGSRIEVKTATAQDAAQTLFGRVPPLTRGEDTAAARLVGAPDLAAGADLGITAELTLRVDGGAAVTVNCAGADPSRTQLPEIVTAVNSAVGLTVASHNGRRLILSSPSSGAAATLEILHADSGDASERLLGLKPRSFRGSAATPAQLIGKPDLASGIDLAAVYRVRLSLDGGDAAIIDLRRLAADRRNVSLDEMTAAFNATLGAPVASHDAHHLLLTSPTSGAASRIQILPLENRISRRFVTQTPIIDEAAPAVFGTIAAEARGAAARKAQLKGTTDLSRGIDLRAGSFLRLALNKDTPIEIDCAGPRPRATTLAQIVAAINAATSASIASDDGLHLILTSPLAGSASRIEIQPSQARDARPLLLGLEPTTVSGRAATSVTFTGTVDLMEGLELPAHSALKIGIDGAPAIEIPLTEAEAQHKSLNQLMLAINLALGQTVAHHNGLHLSLSSPSSGAASALEFAVPAAGDATAAIFGIAAPRLYQGEDATPAIIRGRHDLSSGIDLRIRRFLHLSIDAGPTREIDCAAGAADPALTTLEEIVAAINSETGSTVAGHDGSRLLLTSPGSGSASRLALGTYHGGDAASTLLGTATATAEGSAAVPAVLTGTPDLVAGVDLSQRSVIRLAVNGQRAQDIDIAGAAPGQTSGAEIAAAINRAFPGLAALTDDDRLALTSPTAGEESRIDLLPLRFLEVIEYPPTRRELENSLRHGETLTIPNQGAAEVFAEVWFASDQGLVGPSLSDPTAGWRICLQIVVAPGERVRLWRDSAQRLQAEKITTNASKISIPGDRIFREGNTADILKVPPGASRWSYANCLASRYNAAYFDLSRFTGGRCHERGIFNLSRFARPANDCGAAVFAWPPGTDPEPAADISLSWSEHLPGAFTVNLPADLPARFGGRFNEARFALPGKTPEFYPFTVTEPVGDPDYLADLLNTSSRLVSAKVVAAVPLGWQPVAMPFRKPRKLTLGSEAQAARLYLSEEGIPGFLELEARIPGAAGNSIQVAARKSGPALFDVTVAFAGAVFENARQCALGESLPSLTSELLAPGAVGLLQAKAAGIRVAVTRDRTERPT